MLRQRNHIGINAAIFGLALTGFLPGTLVLGPAAADEGKHLDPIALYGEKLAFEVTRNGEPVGSHVVTFVEKNERILANTLFKIDITLLSIPVYNFRYESRAFWENGKFRSIDVDLNDDGKIEKFAAHRELGALLVNGKRESVAKDTDLYPTNHWNKGVLSQSQVFNTLTGKIDKVSIKNAGPEPVKVKDGSIIADKYVYTGDLSVESWYDKYGRWVKLRFRAEDDSLIEYLCTTCLAESNTNG